MPSSYWPPPLLSSPRISRPSRPHQMFGDLGVTVWEPLHASLLWIRLPPRTRSHEGRLNGQRIPHTKQWLWEKGSVTFGEYNLKHLSESPQVSCGAVLCLRPRVVYSPRQPIELLEGREAYFFFFLFSFFLMNERIVVRHSIQHVVHIYLWPPFILSALL